MKHKKTRLSYLQRTLMGHGALDKYRRPFTKEEADQYLAEQAARRSS